MLIEHLSRQLRERDAQSLRRRRRIAESACAAHQRVSAEGCQGREMLAFCSNDYLGLANRHGRGTLSHFALSSERFIYMGTMGKAAGVGGAFVLAHSTVVEWLIQTARTY